MELIPFETFCEEVGLSLACKRVELIDRFTQLFAKNNELVNLTKIHSCSDFYSKHVADALIASEFIEFKKGMKVADIGSGGGLPGLPLAISNPDTSFLLVDSVKKKMKCTENMIEALGLSNVKTLSERLELIGQNPEYREQFDIVVARALAPLPVLLELAMPLVKLGGVFVAMKGPKYLEEINDAVDAMELLKVNIPRVERYELPDDSGKRNLLIFNKQKPTPIKYPRKIGVPNKKPL